MEIIITNGNWNYDSGLKGKWVGGKISMPNLSSGYHGLLHQWWEHYGKNKKSWLLLSENNSVKEEFEKLHPGVTFSTSDFFPEMNADCDFNFNICDRSTIVNNKKFDLILNQSMLEHVYDPVSALRNIVDLLENEGICILNTVVPGFQYHGFPRDYFRFYPDWFIDAEKFIGNIKTKELCVVGYQIFVVYQKISNNNN
jgi:SAM-dependent methyltransferase